MNTAPDGGRAAEGDSMSSPICERVAVSLAARWKDARNLTADAFFWAGSKLIQVSAVCSTYDPEAWARPPATAQPAARTKRRAFVPHPPG